jgi:hypothetical protein
MTPLAASSNKGKMRAEWVFSKVLAGTTSVCALLEGEYHHSLQHDESYRDITGNKAVK